MKLSEAGTEAAFWGATREVRDVYTLAVFKVEGEPASKARARFKRKGAFVTSYTPAATVAAEAGVAAAFQASVDPGFRLSTEATYGVVALFFHSSRQRRDVDNMIKLVLDGLNDVAWGDDSQVLEVTGRKEFVPKGEERTEVGIYKLGLVDRGPVGRCQACGGTFPMYDSWKARKFCTQECGLAFRRAARTRSCQHCAKPFDHAHPSHTTTYCSMACSSAARSVTLTCEVCEKQFTVPQSWATPTPTCSTECKHALWSGRPVKIAKGTCVDCGAGVSRREYQRCRACSIRYAAQELPLDGTP